MIESGKKTTSGHNRQGNVMMILMGSDGINQENDQFTQQGNFMKLI